MEGKANKLMEKLNQEITIQQATQEKMTNYQQQSSEDQELEALRMKRLQELKENNERLKTQMKLPGHGEYQEIIEEEFLPAVTQSYYAVCHFYHNEFIRCKVVDKYMQVLAKSHPEARFVYLNAEKAPFFISKLQVRVLPTITCFIEGKLVGKIIGFEGIQSQFDKDDINIRKLEKRLESFNVVQCKKKKNVESEDSEDSDNSDN